MKAEDILYGIVFVFIVLYCTYTCTHTDPECWLTEDPIICQKIKEVNKGELK